MNDPQKLNELRDGIFQVAMLLYTEYVKYMDEGDARICVFNDLVEKAQTFVEKDIKGSSPKSIALKALEDTKAELVKRYNSPKKEDIDQRYQIHEEIMTITSAIDLMKR